MISSLLMYSAEHDAQPEMFRNAFSGLWWAVATLTTVGYGDIYPVTVPGRIMGAFVAFSGLAAVAIPTSIITSGLSERISKEPASDALEGRESDMIDELLRTIRRQGDELERMSNVLHKLANKENQ